MEHHGDYAGLGELLRRFERYSLEDEGGDWERATRALPNDGNCCHSGSEINMTIPSYDLPVSSPQIQLRSMHLSESREPASPSQRADEARLLPRSSMFVTAVMVVGRNQTPVKVRNMSANGAMVESTLTAPPGTKVKLIRGRLVAEGTIVWDSKNRLGVKLEVEVSVKDWLAGPAKAEQDRVDNMVSLIKAGRALPQAEGADPVIRAEARQSNAQCASDLEAVGNLIQDLEDDLASSVETLMRHEVKLQNLDIAMQMLQAIAQQLSCGPGGKRSTGSSLDNLRVVCSQALGSRMG